MMLGLMAFVYSNTDEKKAPTVELKPPVATITWDLKKRLPTWGMF